MSVAKDIPPNLTDNPVVPKLTFTVCEDGDEHLANSDSDCSSSDDAKTSNFYQNYESPDEGDDSVAYSNYLNKEASTPPYNPPDLDAMPASLKLALPRLLNIRKMSDHGLRQLRSQLRRMSSISGRFGALSTSCTSASSNEKMDNYAYRLSSSVRDEMKNRKMSVDSAGILKHAVETETKKRMFLGTHLRLSRKSVSFCTRDNVRVYDSNYEESDDSQDDKDGNDNEAKPVPPPELKGKSLIPTFSYNCKKHNYAKLFEENVLLLESLNITEDLCLMGNIRVNMTRLRRINKEQETMAKSVTVKQRASVYAVYTFDGWETYKETKAMVVKAQPHPALKNFETHAMRFYIDCDDMEVGDSVEFAIVCSDRRQTVKQGTRVTKKLRTGIGNSDKLTTVIRKYRDDNEGQFYRAKCTRQLNTWAEKAVRELKNPIIKFNKNI